MPLHLLHHKSWHVYNKDNVERVQRDKEKARRKEEEEELRMNRADQERRLQQLRGNAYGTAPPVVVPDTSPPSDARVRPAPGKKAGHVNLFEDVGRPAEANPERQAELAAEKKRWEHMLTSRLANAADDHSPWYAQLDRVSGREKAKSQVERELQEQKQAKWKEDADPLRQVQRYLSQKRDVDEREGRRRERMEREMTERERRRRARTPESSRRGHDCVEDTGERERKRRKRDRSRSRSPGRRHRKHRHRGRDSPDIDKLRVETAAREAAEKEKVARLMSNPTVEDRYRAVGLGGYSAQFHPEAVRR